MKRTKVNVVSRLIGLLLLLFPLTTRAEQLVRAVSLSGQVYEIETPQGADRIFIFRTINDASFETLDNNPATWTELVSQKQISGYNTFQNVQSGYCYRVEQGNRSETFVVLDYSSYRLLGKELEVEMNCSNTLLTLGGVQMKYYTDSLNMATGQYMTAQYSPKYILTYQNQHWMDTDWETIEIEDTIVWSQDVYQMDSILCDTRFALTENIISPYLYGEVDSVVTDQYEAVAVAQHQMYYIAKRGKTLENEKEGPYDDNTIIHSAPLDVLFEAHPSAKADVYSWTIKRGKDIRTQRTDKDIRYTFDEASESGPVTYMVDLKVMNSEHPECISTAQDTITLNASFILVPNVFTPNGDGVNDEFRVAYRSICEFHCWVYNRWQHLVYKWDDPTKGWDGTYNGQKEPDSAYIYIIQATGCDGQKYKLKGTVNLLRGK